MPEITLNKAEVLYAQLRQEIGKRKHGERFFSVRGIMKRYAVSQSVVDRTLLLLRTEGLLTSTPGSGLFVSASGSEGGELPETRKEVLLLMPRWPSADIDELNEKAEAVNASDPKWRVRVDYFDYLHAIPHNFDSALRRSAGAVIRSASSNFQQADLNALSHYSAIKPTVLFGRSIEGLQTGSVGLDNCFATGLAVHHLAIHGHRRIGLLISEPHTRGIRERIRGALGAAKLHGIQVDVIDCNVISGEVATAKTYNRFLEVIKAGLAFTALLGISGESIQGAINACHNRKVRIPEELSIVAIACERMTEISSPPLDTVAADLSSQLETALAMIGRMAAPSRNHFNEEVYLQTGLIERGSVLDISSNK